MALFTSDRDVTRPHSSSSSSSLSYSISRDFTDAMLRIVGRVVSQDLACSSKTIFQSSLFTKTFALPLSANVARQRHSYWVPEEAWPLDTKLSDRHKTFKSTPEKWDFYNQVVWEPNAVDEEGQPKKAVKL